MDKCSGMVVRVTGHYQVRWSGRAKGATATVSEQQKTNVFLTNAQSMFLFIVLDGVLGPPMPNLTLQSYLCSAGSNAREVECL